jgi:hypothetical protein
MILFNRPLWIAQKFHTSLILYMFFIQTAFQGCVKSYFILFILLHLDTSKGAEKRQNWINMYMCIYMYIFIHIYVFTYFYIYIVTYLYIYILYINIYVFKYWNKYVTFSQSKFALIVQTTLAWYTVIQKQIVPLRAIPWNPFQTMESVP